MMRAFAAALLLSSGCGGVCETTTQRGPGLTGTFSYATGDRATYEGRLDGMRVDMTDVAAFSFAGSFVDDYGDTRGFTVETSALEVGLGPIEVAGLADVCMPRTAGRDPVCSALAGMIDVRALAADCYHHESGVGQCAETIDFTLDASSEWEGTTFSITAEESTVGEWIDVACDD